MMSGGDADKSTKGPSSSSPSPSPASHNASATTGTKSNSNSNSNSNNSRYSSFASLRSLRRLHSQYYDNHETRSVPASVDGRLEGGEEGEDGSSNSVFFSRRIRGRRPPSVTSSKSHVGTTFSSPSIHRTSTTTAAAAAAGLTMEPPRRPGTSSNRSSKSRKRNGRGGGGGRRSFAGSSFLRRLRMLRSRISVKSNNNTSNNNTRDTRTVPTALSTDSPTTAALHHQPHNDDQDDDDERDLNLEDFVGAEEDPLCDSNLPQSTAATTDESNPFQADITHTSSNQQEEFPTEEPDGSMTQLVYRHPEEDARTLFVTGRQLYRRGLYPDALSCQRDALSILERQLSPYEHEPDSSLYVDITRVRYELARIHVALHHTSHNNNTNDSHGPQLLHQMKQARLDMNRAKVTHYERELLAQRLHPTPGHSSIARILHTLGRLYDEELGRYEDALRCYLEALSMEEQDLTSSMENDDATLEMAAERIRDTRLRIGKLHYKRGHFDLAMRTSFSPSSKTTTPLVTVDHE